MFNYHIFDIQTTNPTLMNENRLRAIQFHINGRFYLRFIQLISNVKSNIYIKTICFLSMSITVFSSRDSIASPNDIAKFKSVSQSVSFCSIL